MTNGVPVVLDDRQPPSDIPAERALLGACLLSERALNAAVEMLTPADFYRPQNAELFATMAAMHDAGKPVDPLTLADRLGSRVIALGGLPYLHDLYAGVVTSSNAAYYAEIITDKALLRRMMMHGQRAIQLAHSAPDGDAAEVIERVRESLDTALTGTLVDDSSATMGELVVRGMERYASEVTPTLATGWHDLDRILSGGLRPGTLTIVGARPSVGKTLIGGNLALDVAMRRHPAVFVSLEMTHDELTDRAIANIGGVELDRLLRHSLDDNDWAKVSDAHEKLDTVPLTFVDRPSAGLGKIRSIARDHARSSRGLKLLVVDYLGLITPADARRDRREQVDAISRGMKILAKELSVAVVAMHQLNRLSTQRGDKRPVLSDLRESGAIEQDADNVWLLHRPDDDESQGEIELIVAKNRQGPTETIALAYAPQFARVRSMARF